MSHLSSTFPSTGAEPEDVPSRLAVARNLARIYTEVLEAPLPEALRYLLHKWEASDTGQSRKAN